MIFETVHTPPRCPCASLVHAKYHIRESLVKSHSVRKTGHSRIECDLTTLDIFSSKLLQGANSSGSTFDPAYP